MKGPQILETNLKENEWLRQAPDSQQPQGEGGHTAGDLMRLGRATRLSPEAVPMVADSWKFLRLEASEPKESGQLSSSTAF